MFRRYYRAIFRKLTPKFSFFLLKWLKILHVYVAVCKGDCGCLLRGTNYIIYCLVKMLERVKRKWGFHGVVLQIRPWRATGPSACVVIGTFVHKCVLIFDTQDSDLRHALSRNSLVDWHCSGANCWWILVLTDRQYCQSRWREFCMGDKYERHKFYSSPDFIFFMYVAKARVT
jgi:hypothetical protein